MDWIALEQDPLWIDFCNSEALEKVKSGIRYMLIHGSYQGEERGRLVGRLLALEELPTFVSSRANAMREEGETVVEERQTTGVGVVRSMFRRI